MVSEPLEILLAHDRWATGELLGGMEGLSEEQLHRRFEMGVGSLHDTVVHILGAMRTWEDTLRGRALGVRLEKGGMRTVAEIRGLHAEVARDFAEAARMGSLEDELKREREGKVFVFTRGAVVTHVATHGMHHRAQALNMLRHVGAAKMPLSSVMEWVRMGERV